MPGSVGFQTKSQLALRILKRAVKPGVPFGWVVGDEVYSSDRNLRLWLEQEGLSHVVAIKRSEMLWALTDKGPRQVRADRLASQARNRAGSGAALVMEPRVPGFTTGPPWI